MQGSLLGMRVLLHFCTAHFTFARRWPEYLSETLMEGLSALLHCSSLLLALSLRSFFCSHSPHPHLSLQHSVELVDSSDTSGVVTGVMLSAGTYTLCYTWNGAQYSLASDFVVSERILLTCMHPVGLRLGYVQFCPPRINLWGITWSALRGVIQPGGPKFVIFDVTLFDSESSSTKSPIHLGISVHL